MNPSPHSASPKSNRRTGRFVVARWSLFLLLTVLTVLTLYLMVRSGNEGDRVGVRYLEYNRLSGTYYLTFTSTYGYLKIEKTLDRMGLINPRTKKPPLFFYRSGFQDPWVQEKFSFHYGWILGLECLALFFLVPSVVTSRGRRTEDFEVIPEDQT